MGMDELNVRYDDDDDDDDDGHDHPRGMANHGRLTPPAIRCGASCPCL